jgi:hypothetical protein
MCNVALVEVLGRRDGTEVRYALCAPLANEAIWRRWDDARLVLPDRVPIDLPAEHVSPTTHPAWLRGCGSVTSSAVRCATTPPP